MKGLIFSEFLEYVESINSANMVDDIIDACDLSSGGAYTTVGSYPHEELVSLVAALSKHTGVSFSEILRGFGKYLFRSLIEGFPHFTHNAKSTFELLPSVEEYMAQEVLKLYPDAKLPSLDYIHTHPKHFTFIYKSSRPFASLAQGILEGMADYFGEEIDIECDIGKDQLETTATFSLTLKE
jgi:hypothetical protein